MSTTSTTLRGCRDKQKDYQRDYLSGDEGFVTSVLNKLNVQILQDIRKTFRQTFPYKICAAEEPALSLF
ncbi:hypothetical protein DPMN_075790 [Dreissena polymorpha]|uniref:Uncharacterized protein n=1 Tax=Dreissena polymorpha TaxID=45954 RepID=A0A9D3YKA0_DREPO|nr:hypothetical protein DPMN_075790 [Dreissena polymorpha]